jgi:hypothetical protein
LALRERLLTRAFQTRSASPRLLRRGGRSSGSVADPAGRPGALATRHSWARAGAGSRHASSGPGMASTRGSTNRAVRRSRPLTPARPIGVHPRRRRGWGVGVRVGLFGSWVGWEDCWVQYVTVLLPPQNRACDFHRTRLKQVAQSYIALVCIPSDMLRWRLGYVRDSKTTARPTFPFDFAHVAASFG